MRQQRPTTLASDEKGMASIMITLIFMIVISLIVLGFAQIARREQTESLDRELSTQAFYAAESGINDTYNAITAYEDTNPNTPVQARTTCNPTTGEYPDTQAGLNSAVSLTCLLVNPCPTSLYFPTVGSSGKITVIEGETGTVCSTTPAQINSVTISWQPTDASGTTNYSTCVGHIANEPAADYTCPAAVLQVDIVKEGSNGSSLTTYLTPTVNASSGPLHITAIPNAAQNNSYPNESCTANPTSGLACSATLDFDNTPALTFDPANPAYYLRIFPVSDNATTALSISATCGGLSSACLLTNDQVIIDATAQASGVLRRVQARVPVFADDTSMNPASPLATGDSSCQQYYVNANTNQSFAGPYVGSAPSGSGCQPTP